MPNTTNKTSKKMAPILCAACAIGILLFYLGALLLPFIGLEAGGIGLYTILIVYGGIIIAVIIGVLLALRQRLREIEGGEEDDAKKY